MIPVRVAHGVISGEHQQDTRRTVKLAYLVFIKVAHIFYVFYSLHESLVNVPANPISRRGGKGESKASSGCSKEVARVLKERRRQASYIQTSRGSAQQGVRTQQSETLGNITGILNPHLLHECIA